MRQTSSGNWLTDVAILNESSRFDEPGDVTVYRNIADMCEKTEHWFVEQKLGFALTGTALPIELTTDGERVFGKVLGNREPEVATLTIWLQSMAASVREARLNRANKRGLLVFGSTNIGPAELDGQLPRSVEGLIAYVSMT